MNIQIEITEQDLKRLIASEVVRLAGAIPVKESDIAIEVKSKQNYKSEWEVAAFRARLNVVTL